VTPPAPPIAPPPLPPPVLGRPPVAASGPSGDGNVVASLVAGAVTLPVGWILALAIFANLEGRPDDYFSDRFVQSTALLVLLAAPVALLLAWGEVDVSAVGLVPLGGAVYVEAGGESVAGGLLVAAGVGLGAGLAVGVVRWLTRAPSALLSLGAAFLATGVAFRVAGPQPRQVEAGITGSGLPVALALGVLLLTVVAGLAVTLLGPSLAPSAAASGGRTPSDGPDLRVIPGFALSGLAVSLYGATLAGVQQFYGRFDGTFVLMTLFAVVAVAGVAARGSALVAPLTVAAAAPAVALLDDALLLGDWRIEDRILLLGGLVAGGAIVAHTAQRLLGRRT
jgi:hypothetical protein